jgi:hypothetical protein
MKSEDIIAGIVFGSIVVIGLIVCFFGYKRLTVDPYHESEWYVSNPSYESKGSSQNDSLAKSIVSPDDSSIDVCSYVGRNADTFIKKYGKDAFTKMGDQQVTLAQDGAPFIRCKIINGEWIVTDITILKHCDNYDSYNSCGLKIGDSPDEVAEKLSKLSGTLDTKGLGLSLFRLSDTYGLLIQYSADDGNVDSIGAYTDENNPQPMDFSEIETGPKESEKRVISSQTQKDDENTFDQDIQFYQSLVEEIFPPENYEINPAGKNTLSKSFFMVEIGENALSESAVLNSRQFNEKIPVLYFAVRAKSSYVVEHPNDENYVFPVYVSQTGGVVVQEGDAIIRYR